MPPTRPTSPLTGPLERARTRRASRRSPPGSSRAPVSPQCSPAVEPPQLRPAQPASSVSSPAPVLFPRHLVPLPHRSPRTPSQFQHGIRPPPPRRSPRHHHSPCSPQGERDPHRLALTNWSPQFPSPWLTQGGHVLPGLVSTSRSLRLTRPPPGSSPVPTMGIWVPGVPFPLVTPPT